MTSREVETGRSKTLLQSPAFGAGLQTTAVSSIVQLRSSRRRYSSGESGISELEPRLEAIDGLDERIGLGFFADDDLA